MFIIYFINALSGPRNFSIFIHFSLCQFRLDGGEQKNEHYRLDTFRSSVMAIDMQLIQSLCNPENDFPFGICFSFVCFVSTILNNCRHRGFTNRKLKIHVVLSKTLPICLLPVDRSGFCFYLNSNFNQE